MFEILDFFKPFFNKMIRITLDIDKESLLILQNRKLVAKQACYSVIKVHNKICKNNAAS